jgi:adenine C2-methylase RlmN of 23S rRNA A2503 and tRNA A37
LLNIPAEPSPELRIPGAAAQTRLVSMSGIRLFRRKSTQSFKGIIRDDISEFESSMLSQAGAVSVRAARMTFRSILWKLASLGQWTTN